MIYDLIISVFQSSSLQFCHISIKPASSSCPSSSLPVAKNFRLSRRLFILTFPYRVIHYGLPDNIDFDTKDRLFPRYTRLGLAWPGLTASLETVSTVITRREQGRQGRQGGEEEREEVNIQVQRSQKGIHIYNHVRQIRPLFQIP